MTEHLTSERGHAVVVMGVAGCGKSTIGSLLAARWGVRFVDADDLHPPSNVAKMTAGVPLDDADRLPWLRRVGTVLAEETVLERDVVVACSALRRTYRDELRRSAGHDVTFVHLDADRDVLADRIAGRVDYFLPPALLDSQLAVLEPLDTDETGVTIDIAEPPDLVVERAAAWRRARTAGSR